MNDHTKATTVIGPDTHIKGEMHFDSTARILGSFEGRISANGEIQIGEGAVCKAAVEGETVIVDGMVEGDVAARDRITLNAQAKVIGDVVATTLVVAEGATFIGHVRVGAEAHNLKDEQPPQQKRPQGISAAPRPVPAHGPVNTQKPAEIEQTLAGLEARLAGMGRSRPEPVANGTDNGNH